MDHKKSEEEASDDQHSDTVRRPRTAILSRLAGGASERTIELVS